MQHPPRHLPDMVGEWRNGHKVVQMVRQKTGQIGFVKNLLSTVFYKVLNLISEYPVVPGAADFQLLDRHVAKHIIDTKGGQHYIRGMVGWIGFNPITIEYAADARHSGEASYSLWKSLSLAKTAILSMSKVPLRLGIYFGTLVAFLCFAYITYSVTMWVNGETIPGWTSLIVVFLFLGSVQIIILGIIGEYIGQIYNMERNFPPYVTYSEDEDL